MEKKYLMPIFNFTEKDLMEICEICPEVNEAHQNFLNAVPLSEITIMSYDFIADTTDGSKLSKVNINFDDEAIEKKDFHDETVKQAKLNFMPAFEKLSEIAYWRAYFRAHKFGEKQYA